MAFRTTAADSWPYTGAASRRSTESGRVNGQVGAVICCGLGYLAVLLLGAAGSTGSTAAGTFGSVDPVAQALIRHMAHGARHAKPGDWISYRTDAGGGRVSFWRLAAVGAEKDALGRDALWIEFELGLHEDLRAPLLQMKMLVARGEGLAAEGVTRLFVALGADPPQEIPPERLRTLWRSPFSAARLRSRLSADEIIRAGDVALGEVIDGHASPAHQSVDHFAAHRRLFSGDEIIRAGEEARLMTRAGTVPAVPIEIYHRGSLIERIWMSHQLPLLGLAKLEMPAIGHAMEVTGFGTDATPRMITPQTVEPTIRLDARADSEGAQ